MRGGIEYCAKAIRDSVTMEDVVGRYMPEAIRKKGKMVCPFHNERTPSLRLYNDHFYCFGCGAHGDVLDFVGRILDTKTQDAIERVNADFALGLPVSGKPKLSELQRASRITRDNALFRRREQERKTRSLEMYLDALDELTRLERNSVDYAPIAPNEPWHPQFVEALKNLERQRYLAGELWMKI